MLSIDSGYHELWSIGNNTHGQQGNGTNIDIKEISLITTFKKPVKDVATAEYGATYILFGDGTYECCGYNECGQLGTKTNINRNQWHKVKQSIRKIFTSVSSAHSFCIAQTKQLYAVGWNANNQFGFKTNSNENSSWTQIKGKTIVIKNIATSWKHTAFLSQKGEIYVAGCSYDGALGLGLNITISPTMSQIQAKTKFSTICCGLYHTLAIDEKQTLWSWGSSEYGQLGHGNYKSVWKPKQINYFMRHIYDDEINIVKISCGHRHNMVLSSEMKINEVVNKLYLFGNNKFGQCGNGFNDAVLVPISNSTLEGKEIISIKCGANHNVVKTAGNHYYLWGDNEYNQCICFEDFAPEKQIYRPLLFNLSLFQKITKQLIEIYSGCQYEIKKEVIEIYPGYKETRIITVDSKQPQEEHLVDGYLRELQQRNNIYAPTSVIYKAKICILQLLHGFIGEYVSNELTKEAVIVETEATKSTTKENKKPKFAAITSVFGKMKKSNV